MNAGNQMKLARLECLRAFFERCTENGWHVERWWRRIRIKVNTPIKAGGEERDVHILLSMLFDIPESVANNDGLVVLISEGMFSSESLTIELK